MDMEDPILALESPNTSRSIDRLTHILGAIIPMLTPNRVPRLKAFQSSKHKYVTFM